MLQDSQKRRLDGERQVGNLVEEQGTAVSQLEVALPASIRARERALLVAEQLGLDQRVGNRTAVERDKGLLSAIAHLMDGAGHQLLTGARLALDEHRQHGLGDLLDVFGDYLRLRARPHQPAERARAGELNFELVDLGEQLPMSQSLPDRNHDLRGPEWLRQVVVGPQPNRFDGRADVAVTGQDDHRGL